MFAPSMSQYVNYALYLFQDQVTQKDSSLTIENLMNIEDYTDNLSLYRAYMDEVGEQSFGSLSILDIINNHQVALRQKPWYSDGALTITYKGTESRTDIEGFKFALYDFKIDKTIWNDKIALTTKVDKFTPLQVCILPIVTLKLGDMSQLLFKGMNNGSFVPEYHSGEYLRIIPNLNVEGNSYKNEQAISLKQPIPASNSVLRMDSSKIANFTEDEDTIAFTFKVPLFHYYETRVPDDIKIDSRVSFSKSQIIGFENAVIDISFIFPQFTDWVVEPNYLYCIDTLMSDQMIHTINYSDVSPDDIEAKIKEYPYVPYTYTSVNNVKYDFDVRSWKVESPDYFTGDEYEWWKSHFRWWFTTRTREYQGIKFTDYYFTTSLPTYGVQFLGDAGAYLSYTASSMSDQTKGSSGTTNSISTPGVFSFYKTGTGYFTNGLLVKIPNTEIIADEDISSILCMRKQDDRCLLNYDPELDFKYTNKFFYPSGSESVAFWTFGVGSKSVSTKAINGYISGSLLGLLCGFGTNWRPL